MAADLGFVVHAAQARPHELAPDRARDALAERRLADAGRADEAQDRAAALRLSLRTARYSRIRRFTLSRP